MSSPSIQSALQQMQGLRHKRLSLLKGSMWQPLLVKVALMSCSPLYSELIGCSKASTKAMAFQAGEPNIELNDVMVDMQKASVAFQMGMQVRNRLVTAYRDVMNMQV